MTGRLETLISLSFPPPPRRPAAHTAPPPAAPPSSAQLRARAVIFRPSRFFFTGFPSNSGPWDPGCPPGVWRLSPKVGSAPSLR